MPQPGASWQPTGRPDRQPHEYIRGGTAKLLTLFRPATGEVRAEAVERATNAVLHPWVQQQLGQALAGPPLRQTPEGPPLRQTPEGQAGEWGRRWSDWGFAEEEALQWPPVRAILIWDNLAGHSTPAMVAWCFQQGIVPLYTPLGGSWLNMAESIPRILLRRALSGQHPESARQIMDWMAATVVGWNADPTPFRWGGRRWQRRQRQRERHRQGGSGAYTLRPVRRRWQPGTAAGGKATLRGK